jgi:hypothetical protein
MRNHMVKSNREMGKERGDIYIMPASVKQTAMASGILAARPCNRGWGVPIFTKLMRR